MKKILSLLLVLAMALTSAMAVNAGEIGARGYVDNSSNANVTVYPDSDYTDANSQIKSISFMNLNTSTFDSITAGEGYVIKSSSGKYYIDKYGSNWLWNTPSSGNGYQIDTGTYTDVCTFHYTNVGSVGGRTVDLDLHVDKIEVIAGRSTVPGVGVLKIENAVTSTFSSDWSSGIGHPNFPQSKEYFTVTVKYHNGGETVTGYDFVYSAADLDYGRPDQFPTPEQFMTIDGFTNDFYVFESCELVCEDVGDNIRWYAPASFYQEISGDASYTRAGLYALTDGTGSFSFMAGAMSFGQWISVSADTSAITKAKKVTYDANGGEFGDSVTALIDPTSYDTNQTVTVKGVGNDGYIPTRRGYEFLGWSTTSNGSVNRVPGSTFTMLSSDVTLYAIWNSVASIRYWNGDTLLQLEPIDDPTRTYNLTAAPITTPEAGITGIVDGLPTRRGYLFAGWYETKQAARSLSRASAYPRSFTISTKQDASGNVNLYAGWVEIGSVGKAASDEKDYGTTTLGGFSMQGVQVRSPDLLEIWLPNERNTVNPGIRFVTVYKKTMLEQLGKLRSGDHVNGDINVYENGAVRYGYVLYGRDMTGLTDLRWNTPNAMQTDCTKDDHNKDHRNFSQYILSTTVVKFDNDVPSQYLAKDFEARAYVTYTDCNGYQRVRYSTYSAGRFAGGCRTNYNDAHEWALLHKVL